jgi:excinuclease ABC subunit A
MKLARELSKRQTGRTLYLLDEPTTGLHFDDVRKLLEVLHRLADLGNSVIIIEHNLDVIRNADWILDLGPEGGEEGGRVVGQGRPEKIAATPGSYTGQFLTRYYASANGKLSAVDPPQDADVATALAGEILPEVALTEDATEPTITGKADAMKARHGKAAAAKPKRARRNTPAEDDLAVTLAKAGRPARSEEAPQSSGPRQKKTGRA